MDSDPKFEPFPRVTASGAATWVWHGLRQKAAPGCNWRRLDIMDRGEFVSWVLKYCETSGTKGHEQYGDKFIGDPVSHAIEELLNLLFYLWMIQRKEEHAAQFGTYH